MKNLDTELDHPSVDTPSQRGKYVLIHPKSLFLHSLTICHELFFRKKRVFQPLVTEPLCPAKKARIGGCRKKRSVLTVFSSVQPGAVLEEQGPVLEDVQIDAGLEDVQIDAVLEDVQINAILEDVQTEVVFEDVQTEDLLDQVETDDVLDQVQTEAALEHVVQLEIPPPSRVVCLGRPTESDAKKKKEHE